MNFLHTFNEPLTNFFRNLLPTSYFKMFTKFLQKNSKISTDKILKNILPNSLKSLTTFLQFYFKISTKKFQNYFKKSYKILTCLS